LTGSGHFSNLVKFSHFDKMSLGKGKGSHPRPLKVAATAHFPVFSDVRPSRAAQAGSDHAFGFVTPLPQVSSDATIAAFSGTCVETSVVMPRDSREERVTSSHTVESGLEKGTTQARTSVQRNRREPELVTTEVDLSYRKGVQEKVREKFDDIFDVRLNSQLCSSFEHSNFEQFSDEINTVGRLCTEKSVKFFEAIGASSYVLDIMKNGHHPVLVDEVSSYEIPNNGSFYKHFSFALPEVLKLIASGRVEVVSKRPKCVNPLHVVVQPNKNRLILDCSTLNKFIEVPKFKYEDHTVALNYFKKGGFLISYDLKDGYNQILIHPDFRDYLGFKFVHQGKEVFARFKCGCFGLKDLPYVFTKVFRPLIKHWRASAMSVCQFLDDGFICEESREKAILASEHVRKDFLRTGAVWSVKKCVWDPVQELDWIGLTWNCDDGSIRVKQRREEKILKNCRELLEASVLTTRVLASFVGQVISLIPVVGDLARLYTRFSQIAVASATFWDEPLQLNADIKSEANFWLKNLKSLNRRFIFDVQIPKTIISVKGDASSSACGSFIEGSDIVAARLFSPEEREEHSTWRELANIHFSLHALLPYISGSNVKFMTDSQSARRILQCGSMKAACHNFAKSTHDFCLENNISLDVEWIPREENKEADAISREPEVLDSDDWGLSQEFVGILEGRWGKFSVDCFSNFYNKKVGKFFSFYQVPHSAGVNAFSFDWQGEFCLLVPPVCLAGAALSHLLMCKAKGVLVVPCWPSSYFWPIIINDFSPFIEDILKVKGSKVLIQGLNKNSLLGSSDFQGFILAIKLDCSKP
jgi:hypothetical protein